MHDSARRSPASNRRLGRGFTLIELMVTLAVAVILIAIAIPNFSSLLWENRLNTAADQVVSALNTARSNALKINAPVVVCGNTTTGSTDPLVVACGTAQPGAVYTTSGSSTALLLTSPLVNVANMKATGTMTAIRFTGLGLGQQAGTTTPYTGLVIDICTPNRSQANHRQISMTGGGNLATAITSGACT